MSDCEGRALSTLNIDFLHELESVIQKRRRTPVANSYTSELFAAGRKRIAQKVGEESVELALSAVDGDRDEARAEAADLLYHLLVLLSDMDIALGEVVETLEERHKG